MEFDGLKRAAIHTFRIGATSVILVSSGCGEPPINPFGNYKTSAETASSLKTIPTEILQLYPELAKTTITVKSAEHLDTKVPARVYNMTDYEVNFDLAKDIYNTLEDLARRTPPMRFRYNLNGRARTLVLLPQEIKNRTMLLLPEDSPKPSWNPLLHSENVTAATLIVRSKDTALSYVILSEPATGLSGSIFAKDTKADAALSFIIEASQQVFVVGLIAEPGVNDDENFIEAKELVSTSLGYALACKMLDISYEEYVNQTKQLTSGSLAGGFYKNPLLIVDEQFYDKGI